MFCHTDCTDKVFTTVGSEMPFQKTYVWECFVTLIALIRFFTTVGSDMFFQNTCVCESFVTLIALIKFVITVGAKMDGQITFLCKSFVTLVALIRFFTTVGSEMPFQKDLCVGMFCHTDCTDKVFHYCGFGYVFSKYLRV